MESAEFDKLISACVELSAYFSGGLIYIGGIAVYLHTIHQPAVREFAETTHDADFYISLSNMADLRDIEEVTPNRRLSKHQLIKRGFEFDIYTERQSNLIVPYDAVAAHAVQYDTIQVASLEHLFVLKLEAYRDRRQSAKGEKDAADLLRIAAVATSASQRFRAKLIAPYIRDEHLPLLEIVMKSPAASALAHGNAVIAKRLRQSFQKVSQAIQTAYK